MHAFLVAFGIPSRLNDSVKKPARKPQKLFLNPLNDINIF